MSRKWWVLSSVACGTFMATLDSSIVNIALPTLTQELHSDLYRVKWVVIVYLLTITCLLLPFGRLADQCGRKTIFKLGFCIFIFGSILCGLAPNLAWLVACRGLQAVGASMLMSNGPAVIMGTFTSKDRGAALGTLAMVVSAGLLTGPSIGGFCITYLGWRSIFFMNIPFGILGILLVHRHFKPENSPYSKMSFDWGGAFFQTFILIFFIIIFDPPKIAFFGHYSVALSRWMIAGLITFFSIIFFQIESRVEAPLFDLSLLKNRVFLTGNLASFLSFVSFTSVSILMPFFLEQILKFPPQKAGLFMTAIPVTIFIVAPVSGRVSDHLGSNGLSQAGLFVGVLGLFMMAGIFGSGLQRSTHDATILFELCMIGLAIGLFQSPNNSAIMGAVPSTKLGVASALLATIRNLGLVTSTGMTTDVFTWRLAETEDFISSLHTTLALAGLIGMSALVVSWGGDAKRRKRARAH